MAKPVAPWAASILAKPSTVQHDETESRAAKEKRLGITARAKKAARRYANRFPTNQTGRAFIYVDFLAGVRWGVAFARREARRLGK